MVRFGIIGAGGIAATHAEAISLLKNGELAMVCDTVLERAAKLAEKYHCRYGTPEELLASPDVDAVTIATPSGVHAAGAVPAARAGKHVFCEKPLDVTPEKAAEIIEACRENNVKLMCVFPARFTAAAQAMYRAVQQGRFGEMTLAGASIRWYRPPEYYASGAWRGTWALDGGGALMNQGIHTMDLLMHFNGDVKNLSARTANRMHKNIEVEDTVCAVLQFANGSLGYVEASTACAPGLPNRIELSGTGGSATLEGDKITRWDFREKMPEDEAILASLGKSEGLHSGSTSHLVANCEGHRRQLADFAAAIEENKPITCTGEDGLRAVRVICGVYESAKDEKRIEF